MSTYKAGPKALKNFATALQNAVFGNLAWRDGLTLKNGEWKSSVRFDAAGSEVQEEIGSASQVCWPARSTAYLTPSAFEPRQAFAQARRWRRFERVEVAFDLSQMRRCDEYQPVIASLLRVEDFAQNTLVSTTWNDCPLIFPTLTLFSALVAPTEPIFKMLLDPTGSGLKVDRKKSTSNRLVLTNTYGLKVLSVGPRPFECIAFWLSDSKRRESLRHLFHEFAHGAGLALPVVPGEMNMVADVFTDGECYFVQRLGVHRQRRVWPREWTHLVVQDLKGNDLLCFESSSTAEALKRSIAV